MSYGGKLREKRGTAEDGKDVDWLGSEGKITGVEGRKETVCIACPDARLYYSSGR